MLRSHSKSQKTSNPEILDEMQPVSSHTRNPSAGRAATSNALQQRKYAPPGKELLPPATLNSEKQRPSGSRQPPPGHESQKSHHTRSLSHSQNPQSQQQFHRKCIGDWDFISTIGAGSMGKVKLARHNYTNEKCAVKIVPRAAKLYQRAHANDPPLKTAEEAAQRQKEFEKEVARDKRTIREGALGRLLFHPHICRLYEMVPMTNHYYMLFEYVEGGQLLDYIVSHGSLNEKYARKFARGIALALDYCHKNNVVHRDLKIENIMINQKGDIKIIDFGLSNLYVPHGLLKTYCGSLYFAAPELLSAKPYVGPEVDIWSLGVVLYVLVCGKVPFDDPHVSVLHEKIKKGNVQYPSFISKECVSLLSRMLVVDPSKRATLQEVIQHPWMNKGFDFVVPNYMPKRIPLTTNLDPEIIQAISSFDLGSVNAIAEELTAILKSPEYQQSYETWHNCAQSSRPFTPAFPGQLDPTCGFHPLLSIYHLVDEMKKRRRAKEEALKAMMKQNANEKDSYRVNKDQLPPVPTRSTSEAPLEKAPSVERPLSGYGKEKENPFLTPPKKSPTPVAAQNVPELRVPEQAHTTTNQVSMRRNSHTTPNATESSIKQQPQAPVISPASGTLDPNAGMPLGFNSIFRRISAKSKNSSPSPTRVSPQPSGNEDAGSPGPSNLPETPHVLSPQASSGGKVDPMVRRGVSMKVTAKEKSSSRHNLSLQKANLPNDSERPPQNTHGRSTSATAHKFHGFTPVEYLPPLPNIPATHLAHLSSNSGTGLVSGSTSSTGKPYDGHLKVSQVGKKFHPTARAKSVGGHARKDSSYYRGERRGAPQLPNSMAAQNSEEIINSEHVDGAFDDVLLEPMESKPNSRMSEDQIIDQFNKAKRNSMPSIEYPKTLFLKGFFSVQTTSTKPLPVIRYNIINVLSKLGVKFQEIKGGFVCVHSPSLINKEESDDEDGPDAITIIDEYRLDENEEETRLYGDAFNPSLDSVKATGAAQRSSTPEPHGEIPQIVTPQDTTKHVSRQPSWKINNTIVSPLSTPKTHRSSNSLSGHRRKISIGLAFLNSYRKKNGSQTLMPPNTPAAARVTKLLLSSGDSENEELDEHSRAHLLHTSGEDSIDSLNGLTIGGGSDMLVSSRIEHGVRHHRSPSSADQEGYDAPVATKTPLKFEINIVKVPLVGLYGVQFKKTLGNTWNYKTLASQILNELNL